MGQPFETVFCQHLVLPESLLTIVQTAMPDDLLPSEALRPVHHFAVDYWHNTSNRGVAPTPEVMRFHFDNLLAEHQIDLDIDPEGTLEWALEALRGNYIDRRWQPWVRKFAEQITGADVMAKPTILNEAINDLMLIQSALTSPHEQLDFRHGISPAVDAYLERLSPTRPITGARFGLQIVDEHIGEVRPGELCVIGGTPKVGKTYMLLLIAWTCWNLGLVPVLMSMEIAVAEAVDRLLTMIKQVDAGIWQRGRITDGDLAEIREFMERMANHDLPFPIIQPEIGQRTVEHMVRKGKAFGDVLLIDQTSFIEPSALSVRLPRYQQIGNSLHELKSLITTGKEIPCFLAHQISREGQKSAERLGRLEMYHFSEAAEVERTADWAFGMFATDSMRDSHTIYLQLLAARRQRLNAWQLRWQPWVGVMHAQHPVRLDGR